MVIGSSVRGVPRLCIRWWPAERLHSRHFGVPIPNCQKYPAISYTTSAISYCKQPALFFVFFIFFNFFTFLTFCILFSSVYFPLVSSISSISLFLVSFSYLFFFIFIFIVVIFAGTILDSAPRSNARATRVRVYVVSVRPSQSDRSGSRTTDAGIPGPMALRMRGALGVRAVVRPREDCGPQAVGRQPPAPRATLK